MEILLGRDVKEILGAGKFSIQLASILCIYYNIKHINIPLELFYFRSRGLGQAMDERALRTGIGMFGILHSVFVAYRRKTAFC